MSQTLASLGYLAGWRLLSAVPRRITAPLFTAAADDAVRRDGPSVRRLAANLRRVVGPAVPPAELHALVRTAMRAHLRYYLELFRLPVLSRDEILRSFRMECGEGLLQHMAAGRGVVIALPHAGNWDAAGAYVAALGWSPVTVAERVQPERLYRRFVDCRRALGMEVLPLTGGEGSLRLTLEKRIRGGHLVGLLADRDLTGTGVEVDFFGSRATMPPGPAMLALLTGAPLYTLDMWYEKHVAVGRVRGPIEVPDRTAGTFSQRVRLLTQRVTDELAAGIAAHPGDWHMLQRVWPY